MRTSRCCADLLHGCDELLLVPDVSRASGTQLTTLIEHYDYAQDEIGRTIHFELTMLEYTAFLCKQ